MGRVYTQSEPKALDVSKSEGMNKEINNSFGTFNGGMSGHQVPINSITKAKLQGPVYGTGVISSSDGSTNGIKTVMLTQTYYFTEKIGTGTYNPDQTQAGYTAGAGSIPASAHTWALASGLGAGWTSIGTELNAGAHLEFEAKQGMLKGTLVIDTCLPQQFITPTISSGIGTPYVDGDNWARRIGIFVNDVLVADTDFNTCKGRFTTMLPFATPVGSGPMEVDVRFQVSCREHNDAQNSGASSPEWTGAPAARSGIFFRVFSSQLTLRNQYR